MNNEYWHKLIVRRSGNVRSVCYSESVPFLLPPIISASNLLLLRLIAWCRRWHLIAASIGRLWSPVFLRHNNFRVGTNAGARCANWASLSGRTRLTGGAHWTGWSWQSGPSLFACTARVTVLAWWPRMTRWAPAKCGMGLCQAISQTMGPSRPDRRVVPE